ncbi:glutamate--tRNA ligase [Kyrpidia spormannii]|uniref:Glutamate--tRNA ligase n=2 Tax=Kyrpidia spormannii TaxID=2055160 RepID=A0A2K8N4H8_9BACL|nr:glutamate--tRNA ligase [Kyrpidia spormannii]
MTMTDGSVRVRFAPSPTGALHLGGVRTALLNWLFARHTGGRMVLRIDDTDLARSSEVHLRQILEGFRWLGLSFDEGIEEGGAFGPYRQSQRLEIYRRHLDNLIQRGLAYPCYCSAEELKAARESALKEGRTPRYPGTCRHLAPEERAAREAAGQRPVYRLRVDQDQPVVVDDLVRGRVEFAPDQLDDFVIFKSDGWPTYHFATVVDDLEMGITHVIRAEEHLSNTPRHVVLFQLLDGRVPAFAHVPMILAPDRTKLSKRHGATSVDEFRSLGFLPQALVNYCLLLGWSPGDEEEIISLDKAVARFSIDRIVKHAAVYDIRKLEWINGHYLRTMPLDKVWEYARPFFEEAGFVSPTATEAEIQAAQARLDAVRERVHTLVEAVDAVSYFYRPVTEYDPKGVRKHLQRPETADLLQEARKVLEGAESWDTATLETLYRDLIAKRGIKGGELIHPTRLALTGRTVGPGLFEVMALLGREATLDRLAQAIQYLRSQTTHSTTPTGL